MSSDNVGERMAKLEQKVDGIDEKVDALDEKVDKGFEKVSKRFDDFVEAVDKKYATKEASWAEPLLKAVGTAAIIAIVLAVLGLIMTLK